MSVLVIALIVVAALVLLFALFTFNRMIRQRNAVDNSWAQIEAALKRRHDLIPNLVESVKGYAEHEKQTFENVTQARSDAMNAKTPGSQAATEDKLDGSVRQLMAVAENYPQLRATENFQQLSSNLSETEDQIQITRRVYNDTVQTYNTGIQVFPPSIIASLFGFKARQFFDAEPGAEATPEVSFAK